MEGLAALFERYDVFAAFFMTIRLAIIATTCANMVVATPSAMATVITGKPR